MKNRILAELEAADGYVSGEQLSKKLGVSRTAVWKYIKLLRENGYKINSVTNKGYMLCEKPDKLDAEIIKANIGTSVAVKEIEVLGCVDSTNEEIKRRARAGAENGLIVAAETQTGGKGRFGRTWSSSAGGIYFTMLFRPQLPPNDIPVLTLAAGCAVCLAIREYTGLDAHIKWPNDIVIGRKKVCGILTEMAAQTDRVDYIAVGIGINVNNEEFPDEVKNKATSLYLECLHKLDRNDFFCNVLRHLDNAAVSYLAGFSKEEKDMFRKLCITLGRHVTAVKNGKTMEGTAESILDSGELLVKTESGNTEVINSGEVVVQGIY